MTRDARSQGGDLVCGQGPLLLSRAPVETSVSTQWQATQSQEAQRKTRRSQESQKTRMVASVSFMRWSFSLARSGFSWSLSKAACAAHDVVQLELEPVSKVFVERIGAGEGSW